MDSIHPATQQAADAELKKLRRKMIMKSVKPLTPGQLATLAAHPEMMDAIIKSAGGDMELVQKIVGGGATG